VRARRHRGFVTGFQRRGRRHRRGFASGPERGDQRGADAQQEEGEVLAGADCKRRARTGRLTS
jgi:hypothetical protein